MKKIKILFISHSSSIGGGEICLLTLVKQLNKSLFEPVVIFPSDGPILKEMTKLGVKTYITPLEWWIRESTDLGLENSNILDRIRNIKQIVKMENPNIIHSNTSVVWEGAIAAQSQDIIHIWHIHEILEGHPSLKTLFPLPLVYWIMEFLSDRVVVVSNAVKNKLSSMIQQEKLMTIYNGIDTGRFERINGPSIRQELALPWDINLAVSIGSINKEKGYDTLTEAAFLVKKKQGNVKFIIVGNGPVESVQKLKRKIKNLNLKDCVYYLGYREDIPRILKDSDFLVLPSITEAFPLVALEAMALGKPVIATDCGGLPEMVSDGESGFLTPRNDPESLSKKILYMIKDKNKMKEMGSFGYNRFNQNYRAESYTVHFENLYSELANKEKMKSFSENEHNLLSVFLNAYQDISAKYRQEIHKNDIVKCISNSWSWKTIAALRRFLWFVKGRS